MKKIAVVLLSLIMLALMIAPASAAALTPAEAAHLHVKEDGSFRAAAPYDFVSLAISPRYAPQAADELVPIFKEYMLL